MKHRKTLILLIVVLFMISAVSVCFAQDAKDAQASFNKGLEQFRNKRYEKAITSFDTSIAGNKSYVKAYVFRGLSYFMLKDHLKAVNDLDKALQMDPENVTALFGRGMTYLFLGKSRKAITDFSAVLKQQPENSWSHLQRGICYYRLGDLTKAISDSSKAISFNPKNYDAFLLRGACYWKQKLYKASVRDIKRARDLKPDSPYLQLLYYITEAQIGKPSIDKLRDFANLHKSEADKFPYYLIDMMLGRKTPVECLKVAEEFKPKHLRGTILQQTQFFVAQYFFINKDKEKGEKYLKLAFNGENKMFLIQMLVKHQFYEFK